MANYQTEKLLLKTRRLEYLATVAIVALMIPSLSRANTTEGQASADSNATVAAAVPQQGSAAGATLGDIVVTARKRNETSIATPVVVTAVGAAELTKRGITSLDGVARIVPQLLIGNQGGSVQGGNVSIRGIAGPDGLIFADQAVAFNIDGVAISKSTVRRLSSTDLAQIEVLKGPQALLYGKNSPGGVVSITTADPTEHFEAKATVGYEVVAREERGEGYVSGPVTSNLGVRLSGYVSHMDGYLVDITPDGSFLKQDNRNPKVDEYSFRNTWKWNPTSAFDARLKINYGHVSNNGSASTQELNSCPGGNRPPPLTQGITCSIGGSSINTNQTTFASTIFPEGVYGNKFRKDGNSYQDQSLFLTSLEMNYHLNSNLILSSITGYYLAKVDQCGNLESDYSTVLISCNGLKSHQFTQETRLSSNFGGLFDFVLGGFYSNNYDRAYSLVSFSTNASSPTSLLATIRPASNYLAVQKGSSYSFFGQAIVRPIADVEIDLGGRYSHEEKNLPLTLRTPVSSIIAAGVGPASLTALDLTVPSAVLIPAKNKIAFNNFSPEATISYRPTTNLTLFASYKQGFLSGGFNTPGSVPNGTDLSYGPEKIKGFEGGVKTRIFDRLVRLNLSLYDYKIQGLQLTNFVNAISQTRNATSARIKGVEFDIALTIPNTGIDVHGSAAYNHARYGAFSNGPCYAGQAPALGCSITTINGSAAPYQDLSRTQLVRAPTWTLSGGIGYDGELSSNMRLGLGADVNYSDKYFTDVTADPTSLQRAYALLDTNARVYSEKGGWELAVIGRNLTNKYYLVANPQAPFTGGGTGTVNGVLGARVGSVSRGREVLLQASYKF